MKPKFSHDTTCKVKSFTSGKEIIAVVERFVEKKSLSVVVEKSIRIDLRWTGHCYEGRTAGMDFTSDSPKIITDYT